MFFRSQISDHSTDQILEAYIHVVRLRSYSCVVSLFRIAEDERSGLGDAALFLFRREPALLDQTCAVTGRRDLAFLLLPAGVVIVAVVDEGTLLLQSAGLEVASTRRRLGLVKVLNSIVALIVLRQVTGLAHVVLVFRHGVGAQISRIYLFPLEPLLLQALGLLAL